MSLKSLYVCQKCEYGSVKWSGRCVNCGEWNSMVETVVERKVGSGSGKKVNKGTSKIETVNLASVKAIKTQRVSTKMGELDRVLGGGLVPGQVILMAGEPGIGKSTILMQLADKLGDFLYTSGEESVAQIAIRAKRLGVKSKSINVVEETDIDNIVELAGGFDGKLKGMVVDSIQTVQTRDLSGMAGSVGQVRECAYRLVRLAKSKNLPVVIVGHVTKQGSVAGPAVLAHLVDTVLWFEGDKFLSTRMLRAVKNRFGPTDEVGIFAMEDKGLVSVDNPEKLFVLDNGEISGNVVSCVVKGLRPMLVEIQSLVNPTKLAYPKRIVQGIDSKRYELLIAVLEKRCGLLLYAQDCYTTISGGINLKEDPSIDLAICMSLASSYYDKSVGGGIVYFGEVGLDGRIRQVTQQQKRVSEVKRLGRRSEKVSGNTDLSSVIKSSFKTSKK